MKYFEQFKKSFAFNECSYNQSQFFKMNIKNYKLSELDFSKETYKSCLSKLSNYNKCDSIIWRKNFCFCNYNFTENSCNTHQCSLQNLCSYEGTCIYLLESYRCDCQYGFFGKFCDKGL